MKTWVLYASKSQLEYGIETCCLLPPWRTVSEMRNLCKKDGEVVLAIYREKPPISDAAGASVPSQPPHG